MVSKFCTSESAAFGGYINYIDRESAVRNDNTYKFNLYQEYMGNPKKTSALFTEKKDALNKDEKEKLKDIFNQAESNGSVMWQHVISFDNRWLKEQGLINTEGMVNEEKLKELTRVSMNALQKKENLENAIWSAAIHFNTDNIHIHIAMAEPIPMRSMKDGVVRGKLKQSSIEAAKSSVVNNILNQQPENQMINEIIRNNIIQGKKNNVFINDKEFIKLFMDVHSQLPTDRRQWNYGNNSIKHLRPQIDQMSDIYLNKYHKEDLEELNKYLLIQEQRYNSAYGNSRRGSFAENKKKDMYYRLGNVILKQIKDFDKEEKNRIYQEARADNRKMSQEDYKIFNGKNLRYQASQANLKATIELTRMFLKDEFQKYKNQIAYETMQHEIEVKQQETEKDK